MPRLFWGDRMSDDSEVGSDVTGSEEEEEETDATYFSHLMRCVY